jgi:hypothetical protein
MKISKLAIESQKHVLFNSFAILYKTGYFSHVWDVNMERLNGFLSFLAKIDFLPKILTTTQTRVFWAYLHISWILV